MKDCHKILRNTDAWGSVSDYVKGSEAMCVCSCEQTSTFGKFFSLKMTSLKL